MTEPCFVSDFDKSETEQSIPERFEKQVSSYPDKLAVKSQTDQLTYRELNCLANRISRAILARCAQKNEPIALLLNQGIEMIAAIIGVLKACKFYLPLDPFYPKARLSTMIEDAQPRLIVTNHHNLSLANELDLAGGSILNLNAIDSHISTQNLSSSPSPNDLAYIFFTSGSTGRPKGVVDTHRNVLHNIMRYTRNLQICGDDKLTLLQSCSFSGSVSSLFCALLNGATVLPYDLLEDGLEELADWIIREEVTIYHSVPSIFRQLAVEGKHFSKLRYIRLEGDRASIRDIEFYQQHFPSSCTLVNGLGATECGIVRQYFIGRETPIAGSIVPIGYAVEDMKILLLDDMAQEVDIGCIGEIAVRSCYLAPGYWKSPDLTLAAFLNDPEEEDKRIYCTGDLGRMRADGCLEYLGRKDHQIKLRGLRIVPGEVEATLLSHPAVAQAVILLRHDDPENPRLIAYWVPQAPDQHSADSTSTTAPTTTAPTAAEQLRSFLAERLPYYMVPAAFVELTALPLTTNGKLDRQALPAPSFSGDLRQRIEPSIPLERQLHVLWAEVLGHADFGITDNFFLVGGNSLAATRLVARIEQTLGSAPPLTAVFQNPTIVGLVLLVEAADWEAERNEPTTAIPPATPIQFELP
ncbi:MAG: non-ribosomal peptide synthetase [Prochlorococcaceae cyanobacterium]